jgi:hypothetical protein
MLLNASIGYSYVLHSRPSCVQGRRYRETEGGTKGEKYGERDAENKRDRQAHSHTHTHTHTHTQMERKRERERWKETEREREMGR